MKDDTRLIENENDEVLYAEQFDNSRMNITNLTDFPKFIGFLNSSDDKAPANRTSGRDMEETYDGRNYIVADEVLYLFSRYFVNCMLLSSALSSRC